MPVSSWARIAYPTPNFLQHSVIQRSEAYGSQAFARFKEAVKLWVQADACSQKLPAQFKGMAGENFLDSIASVYANGCGLIVVHREADGGHRVLLGLSKSWNDAPSAPARNGPMGLGQDAGARAGRGLQWRVVLLLFSATRVKWTHGAWQDAGAGAGQGLQL